MQNHNGGNFQNLSFIKMHGLGNDFMIIDARTSGLTIKSDMIKLLAHRNFGVGFDQLAILYASNRAEVSGKLRFWNADGSESPTCGNATRCVAGFLIEEGHHKEITLATPKSDLKCKSLGNGIISVNMGQPQFDWSQIPLSLKCDTNHLPLDGDPIATNIGNPHCTFFVKNLSSVNINNYARFETDKLFPDRTNVQIAEIVEKGKIKARVWERGVGITLASGSSACAVASAAFRRGYTGKTNKIIMEGGELNVSLEQDGVWMAGKIARVYDGVIAEGFFRKNG